MYNIYLLPAYKKKAYKHFIGLHALFNYELRITNYEGKQLRTEGRFASLQKAIFNSEGKQLRIINYSCFVFFFCSFRS